MNVKDVLDKTSRLMASMTKSESEFKLDFVPVIFANGIDDDAPGLLAAFGSERVQYKDKIYEPNESIHLIDAVIGLSKPIGMRDAYTGRHTISLGYTHTYIPTASAESHYGRIIKIDRCSFILLACIRM